MIVWKSFEIKGFPITFSIKAEVNISEIIQICVMLFRLRFHSYWEQNGNDLTDCVPRGYSCVFYAQCFNRDFTIHLAEQILAMNRNNTNTNTCADVWTIRETPTSFSIQGVHTEASGLLWTTYCITPLKRTKYQPGNHLSWFMNYLEH